MSIIVEATVPASEFALAETLASVPDAEFRMVRLVEYGSTGVVPFLWVTCDRERQVRRAMSEDPTVAEAEVLAAFDEECLLLVEWAPHVRHIAAFLDDDAIILGASAVEDTWHLQILYPEHESVPRMDGVQEDGAFEITADRICRLSKTCEYGHLGLTSEQYETVVTAYEAGYYDVPRAVNQEELADRFDISHQALSERLRRAHQTLIANALYQTIQRRDDAVSPRMTREMGARFAGTSG